VCVSVSVSVSGGWGCCFYAQWIIVQGGMCPFQGKLTMPVVQLPAEPLSLLLCLWAWCCCPCGSNGAKHPRKIWGTGPWEGALLNHPDSLWSKNKSTKIASTSLLTKKNAHQHSYQVRSKTMLWLHWESILTRSIFYWTFTSARSCFHIEDIWLAAYRPHKVTAQLGGPVYINYNIKVTSIMLKRNAAFTLPTAVTRWEVIISITDALLNRPTGYYNWHKKNKHWGNFSTRSHD